MIDDLITSGDSLLQGLAMLKSAGVIVEEAVVLLDREQGGREMLESQGYDLYSALTLSEVLAIYEKENRITSSQQADVLKTL
jgi:uridine monophosphate synthetase